MARLSFFVTDTAGEQHSVEQILSYQISMDWDAACHGVRLNYLTDYAQNELCTLEVYMDGKRIFNGLIDTQRESSTDDGTSCFVYARSTACLLTDNEATPYTYSNPSALALFNANAKALGFSCNLPDIYSVLEYQVQRGVSCFGAINDFVLGISGSRITVDANNCISLLQGSRSVAIDGGVISEKRVINRGDVITRIDYKASSDKGFDHHIKSRLFEQKGIETSKKASLSALPAWQRDYSLLGTIRESAQGYYKLELVVDTLVDISLGDEVKYSSNYFGDIDDMIAESVCYILDEKGERTVLTLAKNIDLEEIIYVD